MGRRSRGPVVPEAPLGWRAWSIVELPGGALRLSSLTRAETWEPRAPFLAECSRRGHAAPSRWCSCGVYAADAPADLTGLGRIAGGAVGQVSLWGRTVEHGHGARSAIAYPARLRVVCVDCLQQGSAVPAAVVSRERHAGRVKLRPACADHTPQDRETAPAREVQAALLDVYAVEPVPDEALAPAPAAGPSRARRGVVAGLVAVAALAGVLAFAGSTRTPAPPSPAVRALVPGHVAGVMPPAAGRPGYSASGERLGASPVGRLALLAPEGFSQPICGRVGADGVRRVACADRRAEIFVEAVVGVDVGPCPADRVAVTRKGSVQWCWATLPNALW
ncbi:MAG: hypothetical protein ACM3OO_08765 [Planctomycetaceae bacterium]